jgi:hypothetical protein
MRKLFFLCLFIAGIASVSFAQAIKTKSPSDRAAVLKKALGLTDDQTSQVTRIYLHQDVQTDSLKKLDISDEKIVMKKMMPILMSSNDKIMAILKPEQAAVFQRQVDGQKTMAKQILGDTPPK